jgi:hypothetical protein
MSNAVSSVRHRNGEGRHLVVERFDLGHQHFRFGGEENGILPSGTLSYERLLRTVFRIQFRIRLVDEFVPPRRSILARACGRCCIHHAGCSAEPGEPRAPASTRCRVRRDGSKRPELRSEHARRARIDLRRVGGVLRTATKESQRVRNRH